MRDVARLSGARESVKGTGEYTLRRPDRFPHQANGRPQPRDLYNGKVVTIATHKRRSSRRRRCRRPSTARSTRSPSATTWRCRWAISSTAPPQKALLSDTTTGGYVGTENVGDTPATIWRSGHRRRLGALAAGAGRAAAEAIQGRAEKTHGPAGDRRDVQRVEPRAAGHRRHVRPEACRPTTKASRSCSGPRRSRTPRRPRRPSRSK